MNIKMKNKFIEISVSKDIKIRNKFIEIRCCVLRARINYYTPFVGILRQFCLRNQGRTKGEGWSTAN